MKEILIPLSRYRRNLNSIMRRNADTVIKITRCKKVELVHMPLEMYTNKLNELAAASKKRYPDDYSKED